MNTLLKVGPIFCWAVAIGSEYVIQLWPRRKKVLNIIAACLFALALIGEYASYRYDEAREADLQAAVDAQGVPEIEWFAAAEGNQEDFTLKKYPPPDSIELMINGLIKPSDIYAVQGKRITVSTKLNATDQVIVKYRRPR